MFSTKENVCLVIVDLNDVSFLKPVDIFLVDGGIGWPGACKGLL